MTDFDTYLSPFTWRYGSDDMRSLWSEETKIRTWRKLWTALARAQLEFGLVSEAQVKDLEAYQDDVNMARMHELEAETHHDVVAAIRAYAEQASLGGAVLHMGATSSDIKDNADALLMKQSVTLLLSRLQDLLAHFAEKIDAWADVPIMAFTHLQPAEPTTLGYRFAVYGRDLLDDWLHLKDLERSIKAKGFSGAVGTGATFQDAIGTDNVYAFEQALQREMEIPFFDVTTQTYPRKQDLEIISVLSGLGATISKFAFDLRLLQSPVIGELREPFGKKQVGSSAMPFKRNPIKAEKICSLARLLPAHVDTAWQNTANALLERTLDDSANRRTIIPESFLICDELLITANKIINGLDVNKSAMVLNLQKYGVFAGIEPLLMNLVSAGADRQVMHEKLRQHAMKAWDAVNKGDPNPLLEILCQDETLASYIPVEKIRALLDTHAYTGMASQKAKQFAKKIFESIN